MKDYPHFKPDWIKEYPYFDKEWKRYNDDIALVGASHAYSMEDFYVLLSAVGCIPPNGSYLEIGVGGGTSVVAIAQLRPDIKCYGIDVSTHTRPSDLVEATKVKNVELILGRKAEDVCLEWDKDIDMLFIDGYHYFPNVFWDYVGWYPFVKNGGKIMFHDMENWEEGRFDVGKALKIFLEHPRYNCFFSALNGNISSSIVVIDK